MDVLKFGGSSVGTPERIRCVAQLLKERRLKNPQSALVVVVSAMGDTTDELLSLAAQVSQAPANRELDMLLSTGERIAMALLAMALQDLGVQAISLTGSQSGIITDSSHRRARIEEVRADRILESLQRFEVVIVAGFQGVSREREITTLGRGGSDTTAVAIAAALGAERCEIYTDVSGIYSADPRRVPEAQHYDLLDSGIALEMAVCGAVVIHPRAVEIARSGRVPLWVRNTFRPDALGTELKHGEELVMGIESPRYFGLAVDWDKCWVEVEFKDSASEWIGVLAETGWAISGLRLHGTTVSGWLEREALSEWHIRLKRLSQAPIHTFEDECEVPLSAVGTGLSLNNPEAKRWVVELGQLGVKSSHIVWGASSIMVGMDRVDAERVLPLLHQRLGLSKQEHRS